MKKKLQRARSKSSVDLKAIKELSLILAGLILVGGLIYYFKYGIGGSSAFEQFPRSLAYALIDQSGATQSDKYGPYGVHYVKPGDTVDMWVTVKNLSRNPAANVWYPVSDLADEGADYPNAHAIGVGTADDSSPFWLQSSSFIINGNRFAYYDGPAVHRGKYMTIAWRVKIANNAVLGSVYPLDISLIREFDERGVRVYSNGRNYPINTIRWAFRISNTDLYNNPVKSVSGYSGKLVYEDISGGLTEKLMSYNLNTGQVQTLFQRTRADIYSPTISVKVADPYQGKFLVVQQQNGSYGYGDKWLVDMNGGVDTNLPGGGARMQNSEWWDAWLSPDGLWVALEKYVSAGVDLYDITNKNIASYMPRLESSPWDTPKFSGYFKKAWDIDSTKLYLVRCAADRRQDCEDGIHLLKFDQLVVQPMASMIEPAMPLAEQNFRTIDFDLEEGMAVGATSGVRNGVPVPPSEIRFVSLNSGIAHNIARSISGVYQVKKVSPDGSWFMYTMRHATGTIDNLVGPKDKLVVFVSRVGDIYQPIMITQDIDGIGAIGWSKDNQFIVYTEYTDCTAEGCRSQLKVFDLQNRSSYSPTLPSSSRPIAVI